MEAINGFSYEEVNPHTCKEHVREYVSNSVAVDAPEAEFDLDLAGILLAEYMRAFSDEIVEAQLEDEEPNPFEEVPEDVLTLICEISERDPSEEAE